MDLEKVDRIGVHLTHCCVRCGCKYGDPECPVETGMMQPECECWDCEDRKEQLKGELETLTLQELSEFSNYLNHLILERANEQSPN